MILTWCKTYAKIYVWKSVLREGSCALPSYLSLSLSHSLSLSLSPCHSLPSPPLFFDRRRRLISSGGGGAAGGAFRGGRRDGRCSFHFPNGNSYLRYVTPPPPPRGGPTTPMPLSQSVPPPPSLPSPIFSPLPSFLVPPMSVRCARVPTPLNYVSARPGWQMCLR